VLAVMAEHGLERGANRLKVYVMAELPSNILRAEAFAERFDGFSIGTNDLTQLALGVDRDSERLAGLFDERDPTVTAMIRRLIEAAHAAGRPVGICGQAPSDHPDYAAFLVDAGIDSISVIPDTVVDVLRHTAEAEAARKT
jgi:pyruvate,water dikinase